MKKLLSMVLCLALCLSALVVPAVADGQTPSVAIVVAGGLGDRSFYDSANEGLEQLVADFGTDANSGLDCDRMVPIG